jgi:hypothetical protein
MYYFQIYTPSTTLRWNRAFGNDVPLVILHLHSAALITPRSKYNQPASGRAPTYGLVKSENIYDPRILAWAISLGDS